MKTKDFRNVYAQKKSFREDGLLLMVGASTKVNASPRLGIVVSKKVAKQAVRRNRIRRVLREAAAQDMASLGQGRDLALVVLPGFELPNFPEIKRRLRLLFKKASLFQ